MILALIFCLGLIIIITITITITAAAATTTTTTTGKSGPWLMCLLFLKILFIYLQTEGKGGREEEKTLCEKETSISWFSYVLTTQACFSTGDRTGNLLLCRMMPKKPSHTSQGDVFILY